MKGLKTVSVVEALAMTLRARVLDGQIDAGAGLTEADVAAEYEVSRPTAKTAISLLVHEGLLRREAHKSAHVPELSRKDVEDLFLVRIPWSWRSSGSWGTAGRAVRGHLGRRGPRSPLDRAEPDAAEALMRTHLEGARDALALQFDIITDRAAPA